LVRLVDTNRRFGSDMLLQIWEVEVTSDKLAIEFTQKALHAIKAREEEMLPRKRPILVSFGCKMPIGLRRQLEKATKKHGIEKTALVLELLSRVLPVLLDEEELQQELLAEIE
jgi:hypothetical protein